MARDKKKESALTSEERLAQALVPVEEQPYPVPKNWCWTNLNSLYQINPKVVAADDTTASFIPMEKIDAGYSSGFTFEIQPWKQAKKGHTQFQNGDVAFAKISPCFENRKSMIVNNLENGIGAGTTELIILRQPEVCQAYTYWLTSDDRFIRGGCSTYSGTVGQQRISMDYVKAYPVPLPPLAEQHRIVARIESLFAKLDEAKEKAQSVLDSFEIRKDAILHKAFSGELTARWREKRGIQLDTWQSVQMQDICEKVVCGKTPTGFIGKTGDIPFLKVYNIVNNQVDFESEPQFIPQEIQNGKLKSSELRPNDVIMNIVGPPLRKIAIIPDTYKSWNMNQAIVRFRAKEETYFKFLYYALINPETLDDVIAQTKGVVGQANISVTQSRELTINLPGIPEQKEIVWRLDSLLKKEQQAKDTAVSVIDQIDAMKKSILAKAFRGELGTNNPSEESAVEMLKKVLA